MLIYKNGRFYAKNSSFALTDGCKVNDNPLAWYRNGINLYTEDESCMIDINFEHGNGGARGSLEESLVTEELAKLSGTRIESMVFGGYTCWCAEYQGDLYKYFEARFDAPTGLQDSEGHDINIFRMVVTASRDCDVKTILRHAEVSGILNSFQP